MSRKPQLAEPLDQYVRESNRARFLEETSHGVMRLLRDAGKNQAWLSRRLGCSPALISKILEGSHNFTLETLADVGLVFDRAAHLVWGADPKEMRFPVDEAASTGTETVIPIQSHLKQWLPSRARTAPFDTMNLSRMNAAPPVVFDRKAG